LNIRISREMELHIRKKVVLLPHLLLGSSLFWLKWETQANGMSITRIFSPSASRALIYNPEKFSLHEDVTMACKLSTSPIFLFPFLTNMSRTEDWDQVCPFERCELSLKTATIVGLATIMESCSWLRDIIWRVTVNLNSSVKMPGSSVSRPALTDDGVGGQNPPHSITSLYGSNYRGWW
jgi:hypothetical protein